MKNYIQYRISGPLYTCAKFALIMVLFCSCEKFLSERSDKQLATPQTDKDLQAILDDVATMNYEKSAGLAEVASDNIFIHQQDLASRPEYARMEYIWDRSPVYLVYWRQAYQTILAANTVIDHIHQVTHVSSQSKNKMMGAAFFFRGYTFLDLAQVFAPPLNVNADNEELLGVVLRLSSDINEVSKRASLLDTYQQIISDLKIAAKNLPPSREIYPTRPSRAAAFAALARCYLAIGDYQNAGNYADSSLMLHAEMLDYNKAERGRPYPFERFNPEVIFYSQITGYGSLAQNIARVDTNLFRLFEDNDLRKVLFFTEENNGYFSFSGDYSGNTSAIKFGGITSAEMLLTRMESSLRTGNVGKALSDLNFFMTNRYDVERLVPIDTTDHIFLLKRILEERRKELLFRGLRWSDVRRLAFEADHAVTLQRKMGEREYLLTPKQLQTFAFLIPIEVIEMTAIEQN